MGLIDDPISGVIGTVLSHKVEGRLMTILDEVWARCQFCLEFLISITLTSMMASGLGYLKFQNWGIAIALGLTGGAVAGLGIFQASSHSNGLTLSITSNIGKKQEETPMTTVNRSVKKG